MAVIACSGAVAISISDQPDPLSQKPWILGLAVLTALFFTALSSFARFVPAGFLAADNFHRPVDRADLGLWQRGIILSMTGVMSFVFAMQQHFPTPAQALTHMGLFALGALLYTAYAGLFAILFDDRVRRLLLAEAMRAFANYLRAKAVLYNPDSDGPGAFRALIDAHAALSDRCRRRGIPCSRGEAAGPS